jgi:hypothetical protein
MELSRASQSTSSRSRAGCAQRRPRATRRPSVSRRTNASAPPRWTTCIVDPPPLSPSPAPRLGTPPRPGRGPSQPRAAARRAAVRTRACSRPPGHAMPYGPPVVAPSSKCKHALAKIITKPHSPSHGRPPSRVVGVAAAVSFSPSQTDTSQPFPRPPRRLSCRRRPALRPPQPGQQASARASAPLPPRATGGARYGLASTSSQPQVGLSTYPCRYPTKAGRQSPPASSPGQRRVTLRGLGNIQGVFSKLGTCVRI